MRAVRRARAVRRGVAAMNVVTAVLAMEKVKLSVPIVRSAVKRRVRAAVRRTVRRGVPARMTAGARVPTSGQIIAAKAVRSGAKSSPIRTHTSLS